MERDKILESAVVLLEEPLKECKPADIKSILTQDHSDKTLAACFASVHNQAGWLAHDIDDEENDEETNNRIIAEFNEWWSLEKELVAEVERRLEQENTNIKIQDIGYHFIVKPFMERNGYRDGAGWWVKREKDE